MRFWGYILGHISSMPGRYPQMPLSDLAVRKTKPGPKPIKLSDAGGLYLLISPAGSRYWRWKYRYGGKEKLMAFGVFPEVSLANARARRDEARRVLSKGMDPAAQKKAARAAQGALDAGAFEVIAREWLPLRDWVPAYRVKVEAWLDTNVFPWIGSRPARELTAADFLAIARRIEARGAIESAHRTLQKCGEIMRFAIATQRADRNPVVDLRGALASPQVRHLAAATDPEELGKILAAIHDYRGTLISRCALRFAPLVFVRPGELRFAEWSEFDLERGQWNIPKSKMKTRQQPHLVPLSRQAIEILSELRPLTESYKYVFPSVRMKDKPISENTVNKAMRACGIGQDVMTGHGFRASARTILDEVLGFRPDIIEHQLAHSVRDPNGRAYNRTTHLQQRTEMMQHWADYLDDLRTSTVVTPAR